MLLFNEKPWNTTETNRQQPVSSSNNNHLVKRGQRHFKARAFIGNTEDTGPAYKEYEAYEKGFYEG